MGSFSALGNVAPEFIPPASDPTFEYSGTPQDFDLRTLFRDPDVLGTAVRVSVRIGSTTKAVDLALFDQEKPITVLNFLAYVNSGRFASNFFHRSVPGFVVQGGGFAWNASGGLDAVPTFAKIQNEPGISNLRGTIAMAKLGGDPHSATSQWFVNMANNAANLDAQNGGFTVFGRVVGNGMSVMDEVAALPLVNAGSPFDTLPVKDFETGTISRVHTVETNAAIVPTLSFSASSHDPTLVGVSIEGSTLRLTPAAGRSGSTTVSLFATDLDGATTEGTLTVNVLAVPYDPAAMAQVTVSGGRGGAAVPEAGSTGLPGGSTLSAFGTPAISDLRSLASRVTIAAGKAKLAGIYWENEAGQNKLVAWQGQPAGVPNAKFKTFRDPLLAPGGAIAFPATLSGLKKTEDEGVWTDLFGSLQPVLRESAPIPGLGNLRLKSVTSLSMTDNALLARVKLLRVPGLVTAANDSALVRITGPDSGVLLARTGASFDGSIIKQLTVLQPAARSAGQGRWNAAGDTIAKLTLADRRSVVVRLKSDGTQIPLLASRPGDPNFETGLASLGLPALGGSGVAVLATKTRQPGVSAANDDVLLYSANGAAFDEAVREEPGLEKFASFSDPVVNDQGEVLFFGTQRAAAAKLPNIKALWLTDGSEAPRMVAQLATPAVDKKGEALADTAWSKFLSFILPDGPSAGPVFLAQVKGKAVTAQNKLGLWAVDSGGFVKEILRTDEEVHFPNGTKRLRSFTLLNSLPGSFGARRSYNSTRSVAVQATFSDRSQAILRVDLP